MQRIALHILLTGTAVLFVAGCDLVASSSEPDAHGLDLPNLSFRSVHDTYEVSRHDSRTASFRFEAIFQNDSESTVYLEADAGEVLVFRLQELTGSSWEDLAVDVTVKACGGCGRPVPIESGEAVYLKRGFGSSHTTTPVGGRWGETRVDGSYRLGIGVFRWRPEQTRRRTPDAIIYTDAVSLAESDS